MGGFWKSSTRENRSRSWTANRCQPLVAFPGQFFYPPFSTWIENGLETESIKRRFDRPFHVPKTSLCTFSSWCEDRCTSKIEHSIRVVRKPGNDQMSLRQVFQLHRFQAHLTQEIGDEQAWGNSTEKFHSKWNGNRFFFLCGLIRLYH